MPFRERSVVAERISLFREYESGSFSVAELCERYAISRETFYVWKRRWESGDPRWFEARSRAPGSRPHATPEDLVAGVLAMRARFPRFGPKKLRDRLDKAAPEIAWPAASTIGDILKREGLIVPRPRRHRRLEQGTLVAGAEEANGEWAMDFKGWFRTLDGARCDPLTVTDTACRLALLIRITAPTHAGVRPVLLRLFGDIGLPGAMRSDSGPPFGAPGAGGLSRLSVLLLKLGIEVRFTPPASPQDNGRHERFHRTLRENTADPPAATIQEQQRRFDIFQRTYNEERPHEALGQRTPASSWRPPLRQLPRHIPEPWYDPLHEVRRVRPNGTIKWRGEMVFIGEAFAGEPIGLSEDERGGHRVRFATRELGVLDRAGRFHRFAPPRWRLRSAVKPAEPREP